MKDVDGPYRDLISPRHEHGRGGRRCRRARRAPAFRLRILSRTSTGWPARRSPPPPSGRHHRPRRRLHGRPEGQAHLAAARAHRARRRRLPARGPGQRQRHLRRRGARAGAGAPPRPEVPHRGHRVRVPGPAERAGAAAAAAPVRTTPPSSRSARPRAACSSCAWSRPRGACPRARSSASPAAARPWAAATTCDIMLEDDSASRNHASVENGPGPARSASSTTRAQRHLDRRPQASRRRGDRGRRAVPRRGHASSSARCPPRASDQTQSMEGLGDLLAREAARRLEHGRRVRAHRRHRGHPPRRPEAGRTTSSPARWTSSRSR